MPALHYCPLAQNPTDFPRHANHVAALRLKEQKSPTHYLTKVHARLHYLAAHAPKHNSKAYQAAVRLYRTHVPQNASLRYLQTYSFDRHL